MSYWRICVNRSMPCRKIFVMQRIMKWRIYCKDEGHVSWVDIYLRSYYYTGSIGIFLSMLKFGVCICQE